MLKRILALVMASILLLGNVFFSLPARAEEETVPAQTVAQEQALDTAESTLTEEVTQPIGDPTDNTTAQTEETTVEATAETTEETVEETAAETTEETVEETTAETTGETTEETEQEETIPEEPDFVDIDEIYAATAATLQARTPATGSIGGEWLVLGLARAGKLTDWQKHAYLEAANAYIERKYNDAGQLHMYKPTENERLALALTALGQNPADFYGYDLLNALQNTAWTVSQGNNASAFALLAYNASGYNASNADALIQSLLDNQNPNGGWAITTGSSDSDTTAMAVQALAPYRSRSEVKTAVDNALTWLSGLVNDQGQIGAGYKPAAENVAQVIVALTELGIDPEKDSRFIRNGNSLLDGLASFYVEEKGGFAHEGNEAYNQMATEQSFYALVSWYRLRSGKTSLYDMRDVALDEDAVRNVEALIAAIGEVTADSKAAIDAARQAWDTLSSYQKELVSNYETLTAAEAAFAAFSKTAEDEDAANAVEEKIDVIASPVTLDSENDISAARKAYNALTATQKALVENYETLTAAETALKKLKDQKNADQVEDLIEAIGTVILSSETAIKKARTAYDALTKDQKKLVDNYQTLLAAEDALQELKSTASVKFTLLGCTAHGENGNAVHTLADGNLSTWIRQKTYKVSPGATVREVFEKALTAAGMTWENPTDNYVESIDGIGEFTNGANSGWMYTLNGTHPNLGMDQQKVYDGDVIVFHYTDDYTREEGSRQFQNNSQEQTRAQSTQARAAAAAVNSDMADAYQRTGDYLEDLGVPSVGSIGGEWMVIGLARSARAVSEEYYDHVLAYVKENIDEKGRLHRAKSTDNSRMILALTAIGKDVTDAAGHNLLLGLTDMDYICKQGINGPIWALIAFDSGNYPIPEGTVTRQVLLETILAAQLDDGGWALSGSVSDPDMTGMALQALAPYCRDHAQAASAVEKALQMLSDTQNADGSYSSVDGPSSESIAQVVTALTALDIDPASDERFIKNDLSVLDALLAYYVEGGGFRHVPNGELDGMATEQGYYALTAYYRMLEGSTRLYDMTDVVDRGGDETAQTDTDALSETPSTSISGEAVGTKDVSVLLLGICSGIGIGFVLGVLLCTAGIAMWIILKKRIEKEQT